MIPQKQKQNLINFNADDVWAAACMAQDINKGYIKYVDESSPVGTVTNRDLVLRILNDGQSLTDEYREIAKKVRDYFRGFTFKIMKGTKLNEFENTAMTIANRDVITSKYDLAVICSLPSSYERGMLRDTVNRRIDFATGGFIGNPNDKVTVNNVEVLRSTFSQQYNVYFVTGITENEQVLFFSYRQPVNAGVKINIKGTVKAHRENATQFSRVKIEVI